MGKSFSVCLICEILGCGRNMFNFIMKLNDFGMKLGRQRKRLKNHLSNLMILYPMNFGKAWQYGA